MSPAPPTPAQAAVLRRNNVVVQGHDRGRPALVFVNGFGCDQGVWRSVAPHFAAEHRIVLFDHVGIGRSDLSAANAIRYASLQGYADDLLEVCDAAGAQDAVLVGHSVGAIIGVLAAVRWPAAFRHLVLVAPSPCHLNDGSYLGGFEREDLDTLLEALEANYRHWTHQVAPLIVGNPDRPELAWELESGFNRIDPDVARRFARLCFRSDHRADLPLLSTPTTVLQCTEDNMVPEVVGEYMHESIRGSELIHLRATGHCPHMSAPQEVTDVLARLLGERWAATEPAELDTEL
ncbi:alpha/beta fold hydrolase [Caenimonas terrae]|uniref:Alpha/beta fold hydrolase n=1 Tax=Caenimonas terrae TaxID=696074 RepID=A0ABW0NAP8_9BURK